MDRNIKDKIRAFLTVQCGWVPDKQGHLRKNKTTRLSDKLGDVHIREFRIKLTDKALRYELFCPRSPASVPEADRTRSYWLRVGGAFYGAIKIYPDLMIVGSEVFRAGHLK